MQEIRTRRRGVLALAGTTPAGALGLAPARAQVPYPTRPVTIVVPFAAGGPTDASARVVGRAMSTSLGQPVVIDNKPGGGGTVGGMQVAQAAADGYVLLWGGTSSLAVAPALYANVRFHPEKSFVPIGLATRGSMMLVGKAGLQPATVKELVAYWQANQLRMGNGGSGTVAHLAAEYFQELTRTNMLNVPYRGGGPALTDLLAGVIDTAFDNTSFLAPHVKSGKLKPYAVTGRERHKDFPDVPTVAEVFGSDFEVYSWFGLFAPAGTPEPVVTTLAQAMAKANEDPEVRKALIAAGLEPAAVPRAEVGRAVAADHRKWAGIIARAKVRVDG